MALHVDQFEPEMREALQAFDKYVVCLEKAPVDCEKVMERLMQKAIDAFENRAPNLRHGIALDSQITIILSQAESERPLCGIYFNLHSPYRKVAEPKQAEVAK